MKWLVLLPPGSVSIFVLLYSAATVSSRNNLPPIFDVLPNLIPALLFTVSAAIDWKACWTLTEGWLGCSLMMRLSIFRLCARWSFNLLGRVRNDLKSDHLDAYVSLTCRSAFTYWSHFPDRLERLGIRTLRTWSATKTVRHFLQWYVGQFLRIAPRQAVIENAMPNCWFVSDKWCGSQMHLRTILHAKTNNTCML